MGVSYLLDTHAVIWLVGGRRVPADLVEALEASDGPVYVSSVSAFEVATKVRLGKLDRARALAESWSSSVAALGGTPLPLADRHAVAAGALDWEHRDPFDRLLAAQAIVDGLTLVTADPAFSDLDGLAVLAW